MGFRTRPSQRHATFGPDAPDFRLAIAAAAVLIAVGVAQFGDLLTFLRMISMSGIAAELNPIVAQGAETHGVTILALAKLALVVFVAAAFAVISRQHRRTAAFVATFATMAGLFGAYSNLLAIV